MLASLLGIFASTWRASREEGRPCPGVGLIQSRAVYDYDRRGFGSCESQTCLQTNRTSGCLHALVAQPVHSVFREVTTAQSTGERTSHWVPCLGGCVLSPALSSCHGWEPFIYFFIYFLNAFYERLSDEVVDIAVHDANGCHQRFFRTIPPINTYRMQYCFRNILETIINK